MDQYVVSVLLVSTGKTPVPGCSPALVSPSPGCRGDRGPHSLARGSTSCHHTQGPGCCPNSGCMCMTVGEPCSVSWGWESPGLFQAAPAKVEPHGTHLCPPKSSSEPCALLCPSILCHAMSIQSVPVPVHPICAMAIQPVPCGADLSCTFPATHWPPAVPQVCSDVSHSFVSL